MKKKELMKLRTLKATPKMMKLADGDIPVRHAYSFGGGGYEKYQYGLYMRCQIFDGILKVAFFLPEHMRSGRNLPAYELFISREQSRFLTYDRILDRWLTAKVDMLPWPSSTYHSETKWINPEGHTAIKNYLGVKHGGYRGILEYQQGIRAEELKRRHKKETDPWDLALSQTPSLPKDWDRWCAKVGIQENYIFYEYSRKGARTGYCTYCEKDVPVKRPRHNKEGVCPRCRKKITYKAAGKAGTVETERRCMYLIQSCEDGFIVRGFCGSRRYEKGKYRSGTTNVLEGRRVIYNLSGKCLGTYYWGEYKHCEMRWIQTSSLDYYWHRNYSGRIYGKTLPHLAVKELKFTGLAEYISRMRAIDPERYLAVLKEQPVLEKLVKADLPVLADEVLKSPYRFDEKIYPGRDSLTSILGIDSQRLKRLRVNKGGSRFLKWLQHEKTAGKNIPDTTISWFCLHDILPERLEFILDSMNEVQIYNYIRRQMAENRMNSGEILDTWEDYLSMARSLGMDTGDEIIYRVRKLCQRHDELVALCEDKDVSIKTGEVLKEFPRINEVLSSLKKYEYADEDYTILAPSSVEDIIWEGRKLSHCVGKSDRYWERIERRVAFVLFLRKTGETSRPYYTLEIEPDGTVRQKRTEFDRQKEDIEDAKKFLMKWQGEITKRLSAEDQELAQQSSIQRELDFIELREERVTIQTGELAGRLLVDVLMEDLMVNPYLKKPEELPKAA